MDNNDNRINQIFGYLAKAVSAAADGVSEVMQSAGSVVGQRYDHFRLGVELGHLEAEQGHLFYKIGRTTFRVKTGVYGEKGAEGETGDGQAEVDKLMELAQDKQAQIDEITEKINEYNGDVICPGCGKVCTVDDVYCSACGTKLPVKPAAPPPEEAPAAAEEDAADKPGNKPEEADKPEEKKKPKGK